MKNDSNKEQTDRSLFNDIAEQYCKKDLAPAARIARRHRLRKTLAILPSGTKESILEVGCGGGFSANYLKGLYKEFTGIDYAEKLIDTARNLNSSDNVHFEAMNIKNYEPEKKFDAIFMIGVLHHFDNPGEILKHITTLLKPGGWVIANEPQSANIIIQATRKIRARIDSSYSAEQIQFSSKDLKELYEKTGLSNIRIKPQGFFSTPLAEVIINPQPLFMPFALLTVFFDNVLSMLGKALIPFSWNLVAAGQLEQQPKKT